MGHVRQGNSTFGVAWIARVTQFPAPFLHIDQLYVRPEYFTDCIRKGNAPRERGPDLFFFLVFVHVPNLPNLKKRLETLKPVPLLVLSNLPNLPYLKYTFL